LGARLDWPIDMSDRSVLASHDIAAGAAPRSPIAIFEHGAARPPALVTAFATLQVVVWTLTPTLFHQAPPVDVVEGYLFGREGILLGDKHPNLPGLMLHLTYLVTGAYGWPAYLLAQLCAAATYLFVYLLGRDLLGPKAAAAGVLLLAGCYYFSWPLPEFNHNVAEMPIWAAFAYLLWNAVERRSLALWLLLGLVSAIGLYCKFSMLLIIGSGGLWLLSDARGRACLKSFAPWLGLALFLAAVAPLWEALRQAQFAPLVYAAGRSTERGQGFPPFVGAQLADIAGMLAVLAAAILLPRSGGAELSPEHASADSSRVRFLLVVALTPIAATGLIALLSGANAMWGMSMFDLVGLFIVMPFEGRIDSVALKRIAAAAFFLLLVLPAAYAGAHLIAPIDDAKRPALRTLWPQAAIAERMAADWARMTHAPLRIVAGDSRVAGLVALTAPDRPRLYPDPDPHTSPEMFAERVMREGLLDEGVLIVWEDYRRGRPWAWRDIIAERPVEKEDVRWASSDDRSPLHLAYVIVPPTAKSGAP
jgi:hypothetical protein